MEVNSIQQPTTTRAKAIAGTAAGVATLAAGTLLALHKGKGAQVADTFQKAAGAAEAVGEKAAKAAETVGQKAAGTAEAVGQKAAKAAEAVGQKAAGAAEAAKEKVAKPFISKITGAVSGAAKKVGGALKKVGQVLVWPFKKAFQGAKFVAGKIAGLFHKKAEPVAEAVKAAAEQPIG